MGKEGEEGEKGRAEDARLPAAALFRYPASKSRSKFDLAQGPGPFFASTGAARDALDTHHVTCAEDGRHDTIRTASHLDCCCISSLLLLLAGSDADAMASGVSSTLDSVNWTERDTRRWMVQRRQKTRRTHFTSVSNWRSETGTCSPLIDSSPLSRHTQSADWLWLDLTRIVTPISQWY